MKTTSHIAKASRCWPAGLLLFLLTSCHGEQTLRSDCVDNPGRCPPCVADTDCLIVSNECHAYASCTHRDREPPLAVNDIGCGSWSAYDRPPAAKCGCVSAVCRAR